MFQYNTTIDRVIDGDTVKLNVDLGFNVSVIIDFRLLGINAPEVKGATRATGMASTQHLMMLLAQGALTVMSSKPLKTDKYGRWLVDITVTRPDQTSFNANQQMILDGFADVYPVTT